MSIWFPTHVCTLLSATTNISLALKRKGRHQLQRCNCIRVCHAFSVKIHVYSALSVHSVFLHPCCSPHGPKCFFLILHFTFSFNKMISAEAEVSSTFHPHTITHHPGATVEAFASGGRPRHCRGIRMFVGGERIYGSGLFCVTCM